MAKGLQELIAVPAAAELFPCKPAAGHDDGVKSKALPALCGEGVAGTAAAQLAYPVSGREGHARGLKRLTQHVHDAVGGVRQRVDPAAVLLPGEQAEAAEEVQGLRRAEALQRGAHKVRGLAVIVPRPRLSIRQITAAVARGHELAPDPGLPLEEPDLVAQPRRRQRGRHAGGTGADDCRPHCS